MNNNTFYNQGGAQPAGSGAASPTPASNPEQPKVGEPVTLEVLEAKFQEFERRVQSSTDKAIGSVNKKVAEAQSKANEAIRVIESGGVALTETQKAEITRNAINQAYTEQQSPQGSLPNGQGQGSQPQADAIAEFVNSTIYEYMTSKGVTLAPEEMQPYANLRPDKFIAKAEELIDQKAKARSLSAIPNQAPGGAVPEGAEAVRKEYEAELKEIREGTHPTIRRGDDERLSALVAAYRKRGMVGLP